MAEGGVQGVQRVAEFYRVCVVVLLVVVVVYIRIYQKYFMHISCAFMNLKLSFLANKLDAQLSYRASCLAPCPLLYSTPLLWLLSTSLLSFCAARLLLLLLILSQASKSSCK